MLVEDDPASRNALRAILTRFGLEVVLAPTLAEALRLSREPFQYIIMDLMLPDGDGLDLLRAIRALPNPTRTAVVTGSSDGSKIHAVRLMNPDVFLFKPIVLEDLLRGLGIDAGPGTSVGRAGPANRHPGS